MDKLEELQYNLIRSHAAGVGNPLSPEKTKMLLALRINVLAKGYSGISLPTLMCLVNAFNSEYNFHTFWLLTLYSVADAKIQIILAWSATNYDKN